jgi:hypothetical protein
MRDDQSERDEEKQHRRKPQNHVGGTGFDCGAEKVGDDHEQDLREDKVEEAEFAAQVAAGRLLWVKGRVVGGGQG